MLNIKLYPIGFVESNNGEYSKIVVSEEFAEGLEQIENFNYLVILFWLHKVSNENRTAIRIKPPFKDTPTLGIFATRFPARPNPIGVSTVELVEKRGNVLIVKDFDAEGGTPIIDIKPYIPIYDKPKGRVKLPHWVQGHLKQHERHEHPHSYEEIIRFVKIVKRIKGCFE